MERRALLKVWMQVGLFGLVVSVGLVGCGATSKRPGVGKVAAARSIAESFEASTSKQGPTVRIQKTALEKEFLLQTNLINQAVAALGNGLQSRIVAFKKHGNRLFMLEANQGHTVTTDLPQNLVLTGFPILGEDEKSIEFDFNAGMSNLFTAGDWRAQDLMSREYAPSLAVLHARHSYLHSVEVNPSNRLQIRQIALLDVPGFGGVDGQNVEVKYYLSPYAPDTTYKAVESKDMRRHGFFEVAPQLQTDGSTLVRAARFHTDKPIVFAVSMNTPAEFKRAVKDGIRYWAPLFKPGQLQIVEAPEGVVAPDPDYHVIQWVPHDRAGFAYADAQMDPRTGQVLHGQVYLTSAFALIGKGQARRLMLQSNKPKTVAAGHFESPVRLAGFAPASQCAFHAHEAIRESALSALAGADDSAISQAAQDFVRAVAAHEVGHVLGLRHNFAGSLSVKNYDLASRRERLRAYLNGTDPDDSIHPSSSIMDYLPFEEDVFVGSRIRRGLEVLEYDRKAIAALYHGEKFKRTEIPLFCTDSHLSAYADCRKFDAGASLIEFSALTSNWAVEDLAHSIVEKYIDETTPLPGDPTHEVEEVTFEPTQVARTLIGPKGDIVGGFGDSSKFLAIHNRYPYVSELNREEVRDEEFKYIASEITRMGGLDSVFSLVKSEYYEKVSARVEALLRKEGFDRGVGLGGQAYAFADSDIETILSTTHRLFEKLPEALVKVDLETLGKIPNTWKQDNNPESPKLAQLLARRMEEYVLQLKLEDAKMIEAEVEMPVVALGKKEPEGDQPKTEKVQVKLPEFFYSYEMRSKASPLLKTTDTEKGVSWAVSERKDIRERFLAILKDACGGCDFEKVKVEDLKVTDGSKDHRDKQVSKWFIENKKILDNIK